MNTLDRTQSIVIGLTVVVLIAPLAASPAGAEAQANKKLICYGWGVPDTTATLVRRGGVGGVRLVKARVGKCTVLGGLSRFRGDKWELNNDT